MDVKLAIFIMVQLAMLMTLYLSHQQNSKMCEIGLTCVNEIDIQFNPAKCQYISYNNAADLFMFNGVQLQSVGKASHLGHMIGPNVKSDAVQNASQTLVKNVNSILCNFKVCTYDVKLRLFNSYCTAFYGCPLWNLSDNRMSILYVAWRKSIRKILDLPYRTHCTLLPTISGLKPIECQLMCRFVKFISSSLRSNNTALSMLINLSINGSRSVMSQSVNYILHKCRLTHNQLTTMSSAQLKRVITEMYNQNVHSDVAELARSVCYERECPTFLNVSELENILYDICVN